MVWVGIFSRLGRVELSLKLSPFVPESHWATDVYLDPQGAPLSHRRGSLIELFWLLGEGASGVSAHFCLLFDFSDHSIILGHPCCKEYAPLASSISTSMNWNEVIAEVLRCCASALKELPLV